MSADLESLRIEREPDGDRTGVSPAWKYLCIVLFLALIAGGVYVWMDRSTDEEAVHPQTPEPADAAEEAPPLPTPRSGFTASGWVKLPLDYPIRVTPLIEGRIDSISVVEGDRVEAGQEIARLYDVDLKAELEAAEAKVHEAEALFEKLENGARPQEIASAEAEVRRVEAELSTATEILDHSRRLQPTGAIPLEELQRDESKVQVLSAQLSRAKEQLGLLEEGFRREEIALAAASLTKARVERHIARLQLDYAVIESPIAGVVIDRAAEVGQWITLRGDSIVSLYDPAKLEVRVDVNQDDLARVAQGQEVEITSRAQPGMAHPGRVVRIEPQADEVKNTVPVRVAIEDAAGKLLFPDMVVKARFLTPGAEANEATQE